MSFLPMHVQQPLDSDVGFCWYLFIRFLSEWMPHYKMHQHIHKSKYIYSMFTMGSVDGSAPVHVLSILLNNESFEHPNICRILSIDKAIKLRCWKSHSILVGFKRDTFRCQWPSLHTTYQPPHRLVRKLSQLGKEVICFPNLLW